MFSFKNHEKLMFLAKQFLNMGSSKKSTFLFNTYGQTEEEWKRKKANKIENNYAHIHEYFVAFLWVFYFFWSHCKECIIAIWKANICKKTHFLVLVLYKSILVAKNDEQKLNRNWKHLHWSRQIYFWTQISFSFVMLKIKFNFNVCSENMWTQNKWTAKWQ